ncbi:MAG: deaminase [Pedobacter sp.]|nr:MAG: deaminase [Pedobacter sp.]
MRKLKLQINISIDGFISGPNGELDWMTEETDSRQLQRLQALTDGMDTIIMGRKMAADFINHWEDVADNQADSPDYPYAKKFVDTPKIVFSKTMKNMIGRNLQVENGDLVTAVNELKQQPGKDIIVYGGGTFVSALIDSQLIDELHLFVNPTALGSGLPIFKNRHAFKLVDSIFCNNGIVVNHYEKC